MMNSYEFDQPLDLRLKALNLSLSPYQKNYPALATSHISSSSSGSNHNGSCGNIISLNHHHQDQTKLTASDSNSQVNLALTSNPLALSASATCGGSHLSLHQHNTSTLPQQHHHNHHHPHRLSPLISHQYTPNPSASPHQTHSNHVRHFRSTNIHCQPLNHHQPHPLSRLHPAPPNAHHLETAHEQARVVPQAHPQQSSQLISDLKQQRKQSPPHLYHPMQPIRSLSLSCHPLNASSYSPINSTSPTSNNQYLNQHHQSGQINRCSTQSPEMLMHQQQQRPVMVNDVTKQSLIRLGAASSNSCSAVYMSTMQQDRVTPTSPDSRSPTAHSTAAPSTISTATTAKTTTTTTVSPNNVANNNNNTSQQTTNTASPITRQHSLVSKYNCKPCGIVFSQPETLRAHQESYCTKRDRSAHHQSPQIRSQSAVSPSTVAAQQTSDTSSINAGK